jgi:ribosomal-protein-alanine N-acetyltransferase
VCSCWDNEAFLEVKASNKGAQRLYAKLGFEEVGRRRRYYSDGSDAVLMRRQAGALEAA